ncbi:MAG: hypothetical protein BMS9Abin09_0136 [Gammaproteobacteria bacterium]|nr:MAG: hypothetical protein BMS9Abin09_0136 [Gammaproteobacteria bacterium]
MSWQPLVARFREKRRQRKADREAARARERELQDAIEHVVDEIDPRIRALGGYRKKLKPCVERTLAYCSDLVTRIPGSVEVNSKSWGRDPMVKAFFSGAEELRRVFSRSKEVRDFFDQHPAAGHCYALLSMECSERTVLGMAMRGEVLKRDVKQTSVSFTDHRVVKPSLSEPELRKNLEQRAFDNLIGYALERITELVAAQHSLQEKRHLLEMQLKVAHLKSKSLASLMGDEGNGTINTEALREQEAHTGQALEQAHARLKTLDDYIDRIAEVLGNPQTHLRLHRISMRLNEMNIKLDEHSADSGRVLELSEASLGEHLKRILLIARFPRDDLLPKPDFLVEAPRRIPGHQ